MALWKLASSCVQTPGHSPSLSQDLMFSRGRSPHPLLTYAKSFFMQFYKNHKTIWKPEVAAGSLHDKTVLHAGFLHCSVFLVVLPRSIRRACLFSSGRKGSWDLSLSQWGSVFLCGITDCNKSVWAIGKAIAMVCCRMERFNVCTYFIQVWSHLFCIKAKFISLCCRTQAGN